MSLEVFCIVILLFFLFGLAVSASEEEYYYHQPGKLSEPNNMLTPYSRGYVGHPKEEE